MNDQPPEDENNPFDLKKRRRWFRFKLRDDTQAWYEGIIVSTFETIITAAIGLVAWSYANIPFEAIVIVMLAYISAHVSALWRVYVR